MSLWILILFGSFLINCAECLAFHSLQKYSKTSETLYSGFDAIELQNLSPPYVTLQARLDYPLLILSFGLLGFGQWRLSQMSEPKPEQYSNQYLLPWDSPFRGTYNSRAAKWSDALIWLYGIPLAWEVGLAAQEKRSWILLAEELVILSEVLALSSGLNLLFRSFEIQARPLNSNSKAPVSEKGPESSGSFYSGHASGSFAASAFIITLWAHRYPSPQTKWWGAAASLTLATGISALRVAAGKHYPSDVIAGAAMGTLIGYSIPKLHEIKINDRFSGSLLPFLGNAKQGLQFTLNY